MRRLKSSGIGGQAVIEGVMMKNKDQYAVAVRTPDNEIVVDKQEYHSVAEKHPWMRLPLIRGVVTFVESLSIGMKTLTYSASFYEEEEEQGKKEKKEEKKENRFEGIIMGFTVVIALVVAVALFMILPWFIAEQAGSLIENTIVQALMEGLLRLAIFILYVFAISLTKDIRRVYMYHGAEHKTINCVENGSELTVENVRKQSKEHKRCGTSFLLYVMVISILFFMFIRVEEPLLRIVLRIVLIPVVAGVSYEFIRFAGSHDRTIITILSKPGLWMQALTTREPDDSMIEVAIQSVEAVFDWKAYQKEMEMSEKSSMVTMRHPDAEEEEPEIVVSNKNKTETAQPHRVAAVKKADKRTRRGAYFHEPVVERKQESDQTETDTEKTEKIEKKETQVHHVASLKKATGTRHPMQPIEELRRDGILEDSESDDADDEILSALDKFFE